MHLQPRRIHGFQGTDREYIIYLESLVLRSGANHSPPSPPRSDVRDDAIDNSDTDATDTPMFVLYQPSTDDQDHCSTRPGKRKRGEQRWERSMDEMISDMNTEDWPSRRRTVGLSSEAEILVALDMMIHGTKSQIQLTASEGNLPIGCHHPSKPVLQLLNAFATTTANLQTQARFTKQTVFFREFVFVSLCCVALHNGAEQKLVNQIMQKCISDSSEKNLALLRNGALWVNRMMVALADDGFDYLAYELFVLWGRSIAQYGRFADAGDRGSSYFKSRVPKCKPRVEIQASLPFWVPFIIKTIVGKVFSLPAICNSLGYGSDSRIHCYPHYHDNYHNWRMPLPLPQPLCPEATELIDQCPDTLNAHRGTKALAVQTDDSASIRIQALLEAAQQSDNLPRLALDQQLPIDGSCIDPASAAEALTQLGQIAVSGSLQQPDLIQGVEKATTFAHEKNITNDAMTNFQLAEFEELWTSSLPMDVLETFDDVWNSSFPSYHH